MMNKFFNGKDPKEDDIKKLTELGFEREKVIKALKENDFNAQKAADALFMSSPGKPNNQK